MNAADPTDTRPALQVVVWKQRCSATAKGTGQRCKRLATPGCAVCRVHGGAAPQVRAAGERRLVELHEDAMRQLFAEFPSAVDTLTGVRLDPHSSARDRISAARAVVASVVGWKARPVDVLGDQEERDLRAEVDQLVRDLEPVELKRRMLRLDPEAEVPPGWQPAPVDETAPEISANGHQPEAEDHPSIRKLVDVLAPLGLSIDDVADLLRDALAEDESDA